VASAQPRSEAAWRLRVQQQLFKRASPEHLGTPLAFVSVTVLTNTSIAFYRLDRTLDWIEH
jgi:hypothetical protein